MFATRWITTDHRRRKATYASALAVAMCLASIAQASGPWASEVWVEHAAVTDSINAIEIDGLASVGSVDLLVIDASPGDRRGQVLTFADNVAVAAGTMVFANQPWPSDFLAGRQPDPSRVFDLSTLGTQALLDFDGDRSVMLFDSSAWTSPPLGLDDPNSFAYAVMQLTLLHETLVTIDGSPTSFGPSAAITAQLGDDALASRPMTSEGQPSPDGFLVGTPSLVGVLPNISPTYHTNPGLPNLSGDFVHMPEPGTGLMIALLGVAAVSRCRPASPRRI